MVEESIAPKSNLAFSYHNGESKLSQVICGQVPDVKMVESQLHSLFHMQSNSYQKHEDYYNHGR